MSKHSFDAGVNVGSDESSAAAGVSYSTTGVWPGVEPRQAVDAAISAPGEAMPAVPQMCQPAEGGTRWALDFLGVAAGLVELPVDLAPGGWRLAKGEGREQRLQRSHTAQVLDAVEEYHDERPFLVTLPGPWQFIRHLVLPSGAPVLSDFGAVRDVLQSYAFAAQRHLGEVQERTGQAPRARIVERELDPILTGNVPTDSGFRTLPALPEAAVLTGLQSFLARCGPAPVLHVPRLGWVRIAGKQVSHAGLFADIGVSVAAVDMPARISLWEQLAEWMDSGSHAWLAFPQKLHGWQLRQTLRLVWEPWEKIGMNRASAAAFGVLTGLHEPRSAGLLPEWAGMDTARAHMESAVQIYHALKEEE